MSENDLPQHLLPDLIKEINSAPTPPVGLTEADQQLISVLTQPKYKNALDYLLKDRAEKLGLNAQPPASAVPNTDTKVDHLVAYLETCYWLKDGYPIFDDLCKETGSTESYMRRTLVTVSNILTQRGLPAYTLPPGPEDPIFKDWTSKYDPRFVLACGLICNSSDKRTVASKLAEIEVTAAEWDGWLSIGEYYEYFKLLVDKQFEKLPEQAKLTMIRGIHQNDLRAVEYYHKFTGAFTEKSEVVINTGQVIQRVIEVLSRRLDPATLNEIANDLTMDRLIDTTANELPVGRN